MNNTAAVSLTPIDEMKGHYLIFGVGGNAYAIEIAYVKDIIGLETMTAVPRTPEYIKGIINLRGTIVPIIDMRARFGLPPVVYNDRTCVIVLTMNDMCVGLIVDAVHEKALIPDEDIVIPPANELARMNNFIQAIATLRDEVKQVIDIKTIFVTPEEEA